jgi:ABC-2 type transport system permease protein
MLERLKPMLVKEFIQTFKDPRMRMVLFVVPILQVIVFGYAVTTDVKDIQTAVYDLDNSPESREMVSRFTGSGHFRVTGTVSTDAQVTDLMDRGAVRVVIRMNRGFGETVRGGKSAPLQLVLDGTDSNTTSVVLAYTGQILGDLRARLLVRARGGSGGAGGVTLVSRAWFNENLESRNFYVPGVIAALLAVISLILSSMAIVREKEIGTIEQIMVTPIGRAEFILGKTLPFLLIGVLNVVLVSVVAVWWFDVPIRGNPLLLMGSALLYLVSMLSIGIFISTVSRTQQQAMMTAFFFMLPAMMLSGFIFPIANMPVWVQWLTYLNPLRYFLVVIRGVFLKGIGFELLWPQLVGLAVLAAAMLTFASLRFKKTVL